MVRSPPPAVYWCTNVRGAVCPSIKHLSDRDCASIQTRPLTFQSALRSPVQSCTSVQARARFSGCELFLAFSPLWLCASQGIIDGARGDLGPGSLGRFRLRFHRSESQPYSIVDSRSSQHFIARAERNMSSPSSRPRMGLEEPPHG